MKWLLLTLSGILIFWTALGIGYEEGKEDGGGSIIVSEQGEVLISNFEIQNNSPDSVGIYIKDEVMYFNKQIYNKGIFIKGYRGEI